MILYSTGCPRCGVLKRKLDEKGISYEVCSDTVKMTEKGIEYIPMLEVNGELLNFKDALKYIEEAMENAEG